MNSDDIRECPLCGRAMVDGASVNRHHPVPRSKGGRVAVPMHRICHGKLHEVFTETELAQLGADFDTMRAHPEIARFLAFIARKPPEFMSRHAKRRGKRRR